jgi:hypothetical protein
MARDEHRDVIVDLAETRGKWSRACVRITPHSMSESEPNGSP